ncbi:MAG: hypothetical protein Q4C55_08525 [Eubacterium sp.]|nr:hypothetical protein [Eubacterium sp.]
MKGIKLGILILGVLLSALGCGRQAEVPETAEKAKENVAVEVADQLLWEDKISGMGFFYPEGFTVSREADYLTLADEKEAGGGVVVFLNADCKAQDAAEVYEKIFCLREAVTWRMGKIAWNTVLYEGAETLSTGQLGDTEVLMEEAEVLLRGETGVESAKIKVFYRSLEGRAAAAGYVIRPGFEEKQNYFEDCAASVMKSLGVMSYQGEKQLEIPEDIVFEAQVISEGRAAVPRDWQAYALPLGALCYKAAPLQGDKLSGMTLLTFIWEDKAKSAEAGFEDWCFLRSFDQVIGRAGLQNPESQFEKSAVFFQEHREFKTLNGRDWTLVQGYFAFEDVGLPAIPLEDKQGTVAFTQTREDKWAVFVLLWPSSSGDRDAAAIFNTILGSYQ